MNELILKCIKIHKKTHFAKKKNWILKTSSLYVKSSKSPPEHVDNLDHAQGTCHALGYAKNSEILMSKEPGSIRLNLGAQVLQETALLQQEGWTLWERIAKLNHLKPMKFTELP